MIEADEVGLFVAEDETSCPLLGVRVEADIVGTTARVEVVQTFRNPRRKPIEAVYRFPLSEGASLCGFRALVGEKELHGEVEERDLAFEKYDRALERGHGGYLLDEERPNIFTVSVGNLPPGKQAVLTVQYVETLPETFDGLRFRLPMSISPRYVPAGYDAGAEVPVDAQVHPAYAAKVPYGLTFRVRVHGAGGIASVESPTHPVRTRLVDGVVELENSSEKVQMDRDFVVLVQRKDHGSPRGWTTKRGGEWFVAVELPIEDVDEALEERLKDSQVIFVLDASGSMMGSSYTEAKAALEIMLRALPTSTQFNVVRFGSRFEQFWTGLRPATSENVSKAIETLRKTRANLGGTEMLAPLRAVYADPVEEGKVRNVVLITDGEIANEDEAIALARSGAGKIRIFTVGIGYGPNDYLIRELARASGGQSVLVPPDERIEPSVLRLFGELAGPRVEGLRIDLDGAEQVPRFADGYPGSIVWLSARVQDWPDGLLNSITVTGRVEGEPVRWQIPLEQVPADASALPQLWAREMIRELERGVTRGSRQNGRRREHQRRTLVAISRTYGVLCRETSFLIVEERGEGERVIDDIVLENIPGLITRGWHGLREAAGPEAYDMVAEDLSFASDATFLRMASGPAEKQRAAAKDELLYRVLQSQLPEGGFDPNDELLRELGLARRDLEDYAKRLGLSDLKLAVRLVFTALVLAWLETAHATRADIWQPLIVKSKNWLQETKKRLGLRLHDGLLQVWVGQFLSKVRRG